MPNFDFKCTNCFGEFEAMIPEFIRGATHVCLRCGEQTAFMVWKKAPGMSPDPYWAGHYDQQSGQYFTSRSAMNAHFAKPTPEHPNGRVAVSKEEFDRKMREEFEKPETDPEPFADESMRQKWYDDAEKTYYGLKNGNIEPPPLLTPEQVENAPVKES